VSVQDPEELQQALQFPEVGIVQMPCNLLDWRWQDSVEMIRARKAAGPLLVHVRSALLQGLLCSRDAAHWRRAHVADATPVLDWLEAQRVAHGCADVASLALAYVRSQPWVDGVVVGMETLEQARANLAHFDAPALDDAGLAAIAGARPRLPDAALNPARWLPAGPA
jgi:spore coat polysaccharide biosynthesis protein SpsF